MEGFDIEQYGLLPIKQKEMLEKARGINICGGIPAGGRGLGVVCVEDSVQDTLDKLNIAYTNVDHGLDRKLSSVHSYSKIYGDAFKDVWENLVIEDESISCKDSSSGVKCKKINKGGHWKPFYQTGRY